MLVICYYPSGEDALYNPPYLLLCGAMALLAAVSLGRRDPLRLAAGARSKAPKEAPPTLTAVPTPEEPALATPVPVEEPAGPAPAGAQQHAG
jgi:alpha-1,6-mannosyltransferase